MRITDVDLFGGFAKDDSASWASADCVNMLAEFAESPARSRLKLTAVPGLRTIVRLPTRPGRGAHEINGRLFVVAGQVLYEIRQNNTYVSRGTIPGVGLVDMEHNQKGGGHELLILTGSAGYIFNTNTNTLTRITDEAFPAGYSAAFIDQYLAAVEPFGRYWYHSEVADGLSYNSLDRYASEASPDRLQLIRANQGEIVAFNTQTTEFFYNSGTTTGTFKNKQITIDRGAAGRRVAANLDNTIFWLGDDDVFYRLNGYNAQPISTGAIEKAVYGLNKAEAFAMTFESKHHKIVYWTFPDGGTFGYDVVTQLWHRRKTYGLERWRVNALVKWNGQFVGTDFQNGNLYVLDWNAPYEAWLPLEREIVPPLLHDEGNPLSVLRVQLELQAGSATSALELEPLFLSGDLPSGSAGDEISYTYTAEGGRLPYVFSIASGTLPTGLSLSAAGTVSGEVTTGGVYSWVVRVTDADGQTADLSDSATFEVAYAGIIIGTITVDGIVNRVLSPYGSSWHPAPHVANGLTSSQPALLNAGATTLIAWGPTTSVRRSTDNGLNWSVVNLPSGSAAGTHAYSSATLTVLPGSAGVYRSTDQGASYTAISAGGGNPITKVTGNASLLVALTSIRAPTYSSDGAATWSTPGARLDTSLSPPLSFDYCAATGNGRIIFGGATVAGGGGPMVAVTQDGITFTPVLLPITGQTTRYVSSLKYEDGVWLAGCNDGAIYRSTNNGASWTQSASIFSGAIVSHIEHNGLFFIAVSSLAGTPRMAKSVDGTSWTSLTQNLDYQITSIAILRP